MLSVWPGRPMPKNAPECAGTLFRFGDAGCGLIIRCSQVRILAGPFARVANGIGKAGPSPTTGSDPIVMTYWEAKEAGYHIPLLPCKTGTRILHRGRLSPRFSKRRGVEKSLREYEAKSGGGGKPRRLSGRPDEGIDHFPREHGRPERAYAARRTARALARAVVHHSASRRFELNGHLPTEVREALGGLRL